MPFKTKSRKIAARGHRISLSESGSVTYASGDSRDKSDGSDSRKSKGEISRVGALEGVEVKSEIIKIVLLASAIIGLQIALKLSKIPIFN